MATSSTTNDDELKAITDQKLELINAKTLESDLDFAFQLQLQEALTASLTLLPSSSSPPLQEPSSTINNGDDLNFADFQTQELDKLEQEKRDRQLCEIEATRLRIDFNRRIHDQKLAVEITRLSDHDWDEYVDEFERPFGEGSSLSSSSPISASNFRLYFKGLVDVKRVGDREAIVAGIGVAICDPKDNLIFELSKPLVGNGMGRQFTQIKALIEGLETALALDLKRITIFFDNLPVFRYAMNSWQPRQRKIVALMAKVELLRKEFTYSRLRLVPRNVIKFAFKLARDAILSQMSRPTESNHINNLKETCVICLEDTDQDKMFSIDGCLHKYCFCCMKQHVEAKLHNGMVPQCPHENCKYELNVSSCEKFLTPKLIEIMKQRVKEASIPVAEKVYCPYPRCSALMSKDELSDFASEEVGFCKRICGARKCLKCCGLFCITCRVPWHNGMTCTEYKRSNPYPQTEDAKLKSLATENLWRQCMKCKHMIELAQGCYHMTCRCGFEFCYTCGAEWKNKKATCSCPLWNERNIWYNESDFDDEEDEDEDEDYDDYYDSDSDSFSDGSI